MYNILLLGLADRIEELKNCYRAEPSNILAINSGAEFFSIAFSRIFDLWIIDRNNFV